MKRNYPSFLIGRKKSSCIPLLISILTLISLGLGTAANAAVVTLALDALDESSVGCRVYYGISSGAYTKSIDVGSALEYEISGLEGGCTYYFAAKAYDGAGNESAYSNEESKYIHKSDTDGDGLLDQDELNIYGTNPKIADTDGDAIPDGDELSIYGTDPADPDSDEDGYNDGEEIYIYGTDPNNSDTDGDGILDGQESFEAGIEQHEIIIDNSGERFESGPYAWPVSSFLPGAYESEYQYAAPGNEEKWARWTFDLPFAAECEVFARWTEFDNRATAAPYTIINNGAEISVTVDQSKNGGQFISLGTYWLEAGMVDILLSTSPTGYVVADAVMIVFGVARTNSTNASDTDDVAVDGDDGGILDRQASIGDGVEPHEIIVDNKDEGFSSGPHAWPASSYVPGAYGSEYEYAAPGSGGEWARWTFDLPAAAECEVFARWTEFDNRATAAPYTIMSNGAAISVTVDQSKNGGQFVSLGTYWLEAGTVDIVLSTTPTGYVVADAVMIVCGVESTKYVDTSSMEDMVIDNGGEGFASGPNKWASSSFTSGYQGADYQYAPPNAVGSEARWTFALPVSGYFEVSARWSAASNRSPVAPYTIANNQWETSVVVNQTTGGGGFASLGVYWLEAGTIEVVLSSTASGYVIADAVKISLQ